MAKHDTSRARLLIAMQQFDVHHRGKVTDLGDFTQKNPWPGASYSGLTLHEGRYYPAKVIVHLANPSFDRSKDQTQMAVRVLEKHGFEFVHFGERGSCPGTCCWDGFFDSRKFDQCLPFTGDGFWELLIQRASGSDFESVFEFNGNKRKIGEVNDEGTKIEVLRPPRDGKTEWSEKPSTIDRGITITGYGKMLDSEGVCSGKIFSKVKIQNEAIVHLCSDLLEWTDEGEISIISVGSDSRQRKYIQAPSYFANWCPKFAEKMSPENSEWAKEKDRGGEFKMANLTNVMGHMMQRAWFKQSDSKITPIEFKKENIGDETLPSDCNSRLVAHQLRYAKQQGSTWHFKRWARITRSSTKKKDINLDQFFINTYYSGYEYGKMMNDKPRATNVTLQPKLEQSEIAFTAGVVVPEGAPNEERDMLENMTSSMKAAGFQQLFDCNPREKEASLNSKRVFLLARQSTSVEEWHGDIARGLEIMASIIAPIWTGEKSDMSTPKTSTMSREEILIDKIIRRKFVVLEGVPGTGKTHIFKEMKGHFDMTRFLTFHPSSDYSSFIGGIRPGNDNGKLIFNPTKGHLLKILEEADKGTVLLWIDELNRANVPRVFGDLISLIGNSDPPKLQILNADLPYNKLKLTDNQKKNLHIVATMNTSDRSVTPLDAALRRRFSFIRLQPMNKEELNENVSAFSNLPEDVDCFLKLNDILREEMGEDAILGHSYLFEMLEGDEKRKARREEEILMIWQYSILPNIVDTLMLTQNFDLIGPINGTLEEFDVPLALSDPPIGHGLGEIILVEEVN